MNKSFLIAVDDDLLRISGKSNEKIENLRFSTLFIDRDLHKQRKTKNFMFNNTNENHVFTWKYLQMESVLWSEGKTSSSSFDLFPQLVEWDAAPLFTLRPSLVKIFG